MTLGLGLLEQAAEQAQALGALYERASIVAWLGDAYLRSGRIQEAIEFAGRAFELADHSQKKASGRIAHARRLPPRGAIRRSLPRQRGLYSRARVGNTARDAPAASALSPWPGQPL